MISAHPHLHPRTLRSPCQTRRRGVGATTTNKQLTLIIKHGDNTEIFAHAKNEQAAHKNDKPKQ